MSVGFYAQFGGSQPAEAAPGPVALPGTFQLEDYTSFYDTTRGNSGRTYRNDDVDIQRCYDLALRAYCYNVGWIAPGEWLGFNVTVAKSGTFTFSTRVASIARTGAFHIEVDGVNVTGKQAVPFTRSTMLWTDVVSQPVAIAAGEHNVQIVAEGSNFSLDSMTVTQTSVDAPAQPTPAPTQEPTATPTQVPTQAPTATPTQPTATPVASSPQIPATVALPGTFEAEHYTSFSDTTPGNLGKRYRTDDVDIEDCTDPESAAKCYDVAWIKSDEWLGYDMTVATTGSFTFTTRVASPNDGRSLRFEVDGVDITGEIAVPNTGGYQNWTSVSSNPVSLTAGNHTLKMVFTGSSFNVNNVTVSEVKTEAPVQTEPVQTEPENGNAHALPGTFEVEDYSSFSDATAGNYGKRYRNDDVDIEDCSDAAPAGQCYDVGYVDAGEWLGYDVNVAKNGTFTFSTRVATSKNNRHFRFEVDGADVSGQIAIPNTGGYQSWQTVTSSPVSLTAGKHTLRIVAGESNFNLNNVTVAEVADASPAPAPSTDPAPAPAPEVNGPTYYVSPTGNDTADGSLANPWRNLSSSMKKLRAGDTLLVRGGTYRERVEVRGESVPRGTADARITVKAYPGEEPLVVGIFWISNPDYWTFDNIDVTYDPATNNTQEHMVRMYRGHDWIFQNSEIYGAHSYAGLLVNGKSKNWLITNNYIHDTAPS
ncbi:MAG TPA: carbohydrate-binding protein, partial [Thermomicrobiales bacterium]|nr:carbohydrate-binding protein [Thermomicrobiales bacterium]